MEDLVENLEAWTLRVTEELESDVQAWEEQQNQNNMLSPAWTC